MTKEMVIAASFAIMALTLFIALIAFATNNDNNIYSTLLAAFSVLVALLFGVYEVQHAYPESTPTYPPELTTVYFASEPITFISPTMLPPIAPPTPIPEPQSLYGRALKRSFVEHIHYEDWEKVNIIAKTYYDRIYDDGSSKEWFTSTKYEDWNTGYIIELYFADGLLFFASAYNAGEADAVTFYFWGDQMIACHNLIGGEDSLSYAGSDTYNYMVASFGNIYEKAQLYIQDAK